MKKLLIAAFAALLIFTGCSTTKEPKVKSFTSEELMTAVTEAQGEHEWPMMMPLTDADLNDALGIHTENLEAYVALLPMMNVHATEVMVFQAKEGKIETVKEEVGAYLANYEQMWSTYLPDQYELVKNRIEKQIGNTYYVIISERAAEFETKLVEVLTAE